MGKVYHLNFSSIHCHDASDLIRNWDRFPSEVGGPTVHSSDPQPGSRWLVWHRDKSSWSRKPKHFQGLLQINGHFRILNWRYLPYIRPTIYGFAANDRVENLCNLLFKRRVGGHGGFTFDRKSYGAFSSSMAEWP